MVFGRLGEVDDIVLERLGHNIRGFGATIDKYIGDAIMVFFGDPESKGVREDALACVRMAVAMLRRMRAIQAEWQERGAEQPFHVRVGINTGFVTVGNFDRMDYTIIGRRVNLTARLQSYAELDGILLGHETFPSSRVRWRPTSRRRSRSRASLSRSTATRCSAFTTISPARAP